jgi:ADP-ribosylglycohydrolase
MYGAILGDILGSIYEFDNLKTEEPEKIDLLNPDCIIPNHPPGTDRLCK